MPNVDLLSDLTETVPLRKQPLYSRREMKLLIIVTSLFVLTGTMVDTAVSHYHYEALRRLSDTFLTFILFNFLPIPAAAFVPSLVISLFPIKGRRYAMKLLPVWLWTISILSGAQICYFLFEVIAGKS